MKITGAVLIMAGCLGMAASVINNWKRRYLELKELLECIQILNGQVRYTMSPLPEIFLEIERRRKSRLGELFGQVGRELNRRGGETLEAIWKRALQDSRKCFVLNKEDWDVFMNMGKGLGYLDVEMQRKHLEGCISQLSERLPETRKAWKEREKVIRSLGLVSGAMLLLILI